MRSGILPGIGHGHLAGVRSATIKMRVPGLMDGGVGLKEIQLFGLTGMKVRFGGHKVSATKPETYLSNVLASDHPRSAFGRNSVELNCSA